MKTAIPEHVNKFFQEMSDYVPRDLDGINIKNDKYKLSIDVSEDVNDPFMFVYLHDLEGNELLRWDHFKKFTYGEIDWNSFETLLHEAICIFARRLKKDIEPRIDHLHHCVTELENLSTKKLEDAEGW